MHQRRAVLSLLVTVLLIAPGASARAGGPTDEALALAAITAACPAGTTLQAMRSAFPEAPLDASDSTFDLGLGLKGWRRTFAFAGGRELEVSRLSAGNTLQRIVVEFDRRAGPDQPALPTLEARAERDCEHVEGRRLSYDGDGKAQYIALLDEKLQPTGVRLPLDPPVPEGADPGGVTVALLDTGVNYLQPSIASHLARDAKGASLGYDYWDNDPRPFDANTSGSPFHPGRHGTGLANVLLDEAPQARLLPLRYPKTNPLLLEAAVERAAAAGTRVLLVGLGTRNQQDWQGFADAVAKHPEMLVVVTAGNQSEDIDDRAYYPAAMAIPTMLVVGAADGFGQPVRSNWGKRRVHVLAPAEKVVARNFDGVEQAFSGAEYAAARVAALAARLAAAHPDWDGARLRSAILTQATMSDGDTTPHSAYGVLPDAALQP